MRSVMGRLGLAAAVVGLMVGVAEQARAGLVVVPGNLTNVEGNSNNGYPFNISSHGQSNMRYQQVFAATEFATLGGPVLITQISFRPDAISGNAFSSTLPDIQINLSTTSATPESMSSSFANNVGADDTIVYNRGSLALSSADTGLGPRDFDITIALTTPFLYDPTAGGLLLDVRNFGGGRTTQFDAHGVTGDPISRAFIGNVTSASGYTDSVGLVAQFQYEPLSAVPEPSTLAGGILATLLTGGAWLRRRKRQAT